MILSSLCLCVACVATLMSSANNPEAKFAYGAANINPLKAVNPGLIHDANQTDYVKFLCGQGYNTSTLRIVTGNNSTCSEANKGTVWDLNYPSFALPTTSISSPISQAFTRTVTNVGLGDPTSTYRCSMSAPVGLNIQVTPKVLSFDSLGQKLPFTVAVQGSIDQPIG